MEIDQKSDSTLSVDTQNTSGCPVLVEDHALLKSAGTAEWRMGMRSLKHACHFPFLQTQMPS